MRISRDQHVHYMSSANRPVAIVKPGEIITVETADALDGNVVNLAGDVVDDSLDRRMGVDQVNPATGPIYIEGVRPGDGVAIHIHDIRPCGVGFMGVGRGALGGKVQESIRRFFPAENKTIAFNESLSFSPDPMIGVIGLAPADGEVVWNRNPGPHGGNMDTKLIRKGARVYITAMQEGGLFSLGDVHLLMADGEVNGQGIEINAEVDLSVEIVSQWGMRHPMIETDDVWACVASHESLEEACRIAVGQMVEFLVSRINVTASEAALILGLVGDVRVCQIVNPLRTGRVEVPKWIF